MGVGNDFVKGGSILTQKKNHRKFESQKVARKGWGDSLIVNVLAMLVLVLTLVPRTGMVARAAHPSARKAGARWDPLASQSSWINKF